MQNGLCENLIGPLLVLQTAAATEAYSENTNGGCWPPADISSGARRKARARIALKLIPARDNTLLTALTCATDSATLPESFPS